MEAIMGSLRVGETDDLDSRVQGVLLSEGDEFAELRPGSPDRGHESRLVGDLAEAERDAAAVEAHTDGDALTGHMRGGRLEGGVRSHEINDGGEEPFRFTGGNREIGAEL